MSKPTISACMPHRDYFQYIEGALTSLRLQKHPIQEIVVMDDGSDPKEWERLIKLWEEWPDGAPVLTLRRLENNPYEERTLRIPYIRNQAFLALQLGTPDYIFFPDADDYWKPGYTKACIDIMEAEADIDFVYPNVYRMNEGRCTSTGEVPEFNLDQLFRVCYCTCCTVMRTDAFLDAGMWPEGMHKKEYIFWNTIARMGHKGKKLHGRYFHYIQHAGQRHNEHVGTGEANPEKHHRFASRQYIADKFNVQLS